MFSGVIDTGTSESSGTPRRQRSSHSEAVQLSGATRSAGHSAHASSTKRYGASGSRKVGRRVRRSLHSSSSFE